ncbi:MAG: hypothetical protein ACP5IG_04095 [Candidatus Micrarchaeia archaeon]
MWKDELVPNKYWFSNDFTDARFRSAVGLSSLTVPSINVGDLGSLTVKPSTLTVSGTTSTTSGYALTHG